MRWGVATLGVLPAASLGTLLVQGEARRVAGVGPAAGPGFASDEAVVPDDVLLREQLERAVELRRREDFDRMLDAKEPGELVEHATLTEVDFDHRALGIDTLFVVGDELFGYLFRPENGWGSGRTDRSSTGYTPRLQRIHRDMY